MRPSAFLALLSLGMACATPAPDPSGEPGPTAIEIGEDGTPPIYFEKVLVRLPAGTVYGHVYDQTRRSRPPQELVHTSKFIETEEFNVLIADRLDELGYDVIDPTDAAFSPNSTIKTRFRIIGVVTDLKLDTYRHYQRPHRSYQTADVAMEVRLYDARVKDVVYRESFTGKARDEGSHPVALPRSVSRAVEGALADPDFVALVKAEGRSAVHGDTLALPPCDRAPASHPLDVEDASRAVVTIRQGSSTGSGVLISSQGHLITAAHVVSTEHAPRVVLDGSLELEATVRRIDPAVDVALLEIPGTGHRCLRLHAGEDVEVGTSVFAIGAPLDERLSGSVTRGIVSGHPELDGHRLLQTDASINSGNSGGPILNEEGEVLGVVSSKYFGLGVEGVGFAVPAAQIREALGLALPDSAER